MWLRDRPPIDVKSPPAYTSPPDTANANTVSLGLRVPSRVSRPHTAGRQLRDPVARLPTDRREKSAGVDIATGHRQRPHEEAGGRIPGRVSRAGTAARELGEVAAWLPTDDPENSADVHVAAGHRQRSHGAVGVRSPGRVSRACAAARELRDPDWRDCPPIDWKLPPVYTAPPDTANASTFPPVAFGFHVASAAPAPLPESFAIRLRDCPPIVEKLPPANTSPPDTANAFTVPSGFGFQVASRLPSALTCATWLRATPSTTLKSPPTNQPPDPSATTA